MDLKIKTVLYENQWFFYPRPDRREAGDRKTIDFELKPKGF